LIHPHSATRSDPLRAQRITVQALLRLRDFVRDAPAPIRAGYQGRLRRARLNLAYALLRQRRRSEAMATALRSFAENPGWQSARNLASIARGIFQRKLISKPLPPP